MLFLNMKIISANRNREYLPDLLKGLAVIFMIQVHITENYSTLEFYDSLIGKISLYLGGAPAAPLFMLVMGYFFAASKKDLRKNFQRGFLIFCGGIALNIFRNAYQFMNLNSETYYSTLLPRILAVDIFPLAGLSLMLLSILKKYFEEDWYLYFLLALFVALLSELLITPEIQPGIEQYLLAFIFGSYSTSFFPLIPWFAYPLIGVSLYLGRDVLSIFISKYLKFKFLFVTVWILFVALSFSYALNISSTLGLYYHHGIFFFIWVCFFLAGLIGSVSLIPNYDNFLINFVRWLGEKVTAIYVVQWLIIGNFLSFNYKSENIYELLILFFSVLILSTLLVLIWGMINPTSRTKRKT